MRLEGLHHITMITGDAQRNVDFYADVLGLRLVKKTVNFDDPYAYHLYFGDEQGAPGSLLTWFEYAGARRGRAGAGMIHTLQLAVGSQAALDFWDGRLRAAGVACEFATAAAGPEQGSGERTLVFGDPDGLGLELVAWADGNPPLRASHPEIAPEHALVGIEGARAFSEGHALEEPLLTETLGFTSLGEGFYRLQGERRHFHWRYDEAPVVRGEQGAGTVHHIAWATPDDEQLAWRARVRAGGAFVTEVMERDYFKSIYFREPRGVLFEIATLSPGFAVDEDPERLGEELRVPEMHADKQARLEEVLEPVVNPRTRRRGQAGG